MIWLAWRQQRWAIITILVVSLTLTGVSLWLGAAADAYFTSDEYRRQCVGDDSCGFRIPNESLQFQAAILRDVVLLVTIFAGVVLGAASFARDHDGMPALAQGISRMRWYAVKTMVPVVALVVSALPLGFAYSQAPPASGSGTWWGHGYDLLQSGPLRHMLVGFAAAAVVVLLSRRILAGVVAGLLAVVLASGLIGIEARPHLIPPDAVTIAGPQPPAWIGEVPDGAIHAGHSFQDSSGVDITAQVADCHSDNRCLTAEGVASATSYYIDPDRFWLLQLVEGGCYLLICLLLWGLGAWWARRRPLR